MSDIKLWLDAKREPGVDWVWSRTAQGAITMLRGGCVEKISFAPDQSKMINEVLDWMIENESRAARSIHPLKGGVLHPRGFLRLNKPLP